MTRETKVGLVVACSFLCLVGIVLASRLMDETRLTDPAEQDKAPGKPASVPLARAKPQQPGDAASGLASSEKRNPSPGAQPPSPLAPQVVVQAQATTSAPKTESSSSSTSSSTEQVKEKLTTPSPPAPPEATAQSESVAAPPPPSSDQEKTFWETALALAKQTPPAAPSVGDETKKSSEMAGNKTSEKSETTPPTPPTPEVAQSSLPPPPVLPNSEAKKDAPPPPPPSGPEPEQKATEKTIPVPPPPEESSEKTIKEGNQDNTETKADHPSAAVKDPVQKKETPPDPPMPPAPPSDSQAKGEPESKAGSTGPSGDKQEANAKGKVPPPQNDEKKVASPPAIGAPPLVKSPPITVPLPAGSGIRPVVNLTPTVVSFDEETYPCQAEDTSFEAVSQKFYKSKKYARALQLHNQDHPQVSESIRKGSQPKAGEEVFIPPLHILESRYADVIPNLQPINEMEVVQPADASVKAPKGKTPPLDANIVPIGSQTAQAPPSAAQNTYRVAAGGERLYDIARQKLGDWRRWSEIYHLNPGVRPELPIPEGTELRLPPSR
jgi:hypothetical protein